MNTMQHYDLWLVLLLLGHVVLDLRYLQAYVEYPLAVKKATEGVATALDWLREHIIGGARFVLWCASSHGAHVVVMITMIITMFWFSPRYYWLVFGIYFVTLVVKMVGAEYSHIRARRLTEDAGKINQLLKGTLVDPEPDNA